MIVLADIPEMVAHWRSGELSTAEVLQRRPNHRHVVINDDYRGIRVLDPWTGREVSRASFSDGYASDGVMDGWAFRADGSLVIAFNDSQARGSALPLGGGASRDVSHPPWATTAGMVYDWRGDNLWMKDPGGFAFAVVDRELAMRPTDPIEALAENREWRRATDRMRRAHAGCLRVEPERARALVVAGAAGVPDRVGIIGWVDEPDRMVPLGASLGSVAAIDQRLVLLEEYEATLFDVEGHAARRFAAPPGFHFVALDTVPSGEGKSSAVVLAAAALDGRGVTRFVVHEIPEVQ